jgi:hypothetical protein
MAAVKLSWRHGGYLGRNRPERPETPGNNIGLQRFGTWNVWESVLAMATSKTTNTYNRQNWEDAVSKQPFINKFGYSAYDITV